MSNLAKNILRGHSYLRISLNNRLAKEKLHGKVLDLGGGGQQYLTFVPQEEGTEIVNIDSYRGKDIVAVDLETDQLPYDDNDVDQVLVLNLLEHIFNHQFVVNETNRVLKPGGELIGFVPFIVQYHPDPRDFFRYTNEALEKILEKGGYTDIHIEPIGGGSFMAQYNLLMRNVPKLFALLLYFPYRLMDGIYLWFRPTARKRYPVGYYFTAKKPAV